MREPCSDVLGRAAEEVVQEPHRDARGPVPFDDPPPSPDVSGAGGEPETHATAAEDPPAARATSACTGRGRRPAAATGRRGASWGIVYLRRRSGIAPIVSHAGFDLLQIVSFLGARG